VLHRKKNFLFTLKKQTLIALKGNTRFYITIGHVHNVCAEYGVFELHLALHGFTIGLWCFKLAKIPIDGLYCEILLGYFLYMQTGCDVSYGKT
jgi:hypothetical protein